MQIQTGNNQTSLTQILSAEPTDLEWDALHMVSLEKNLIEFIKEGSEEEIGHAKFVAFQGTWPEIVLKQAARTTEVDNYHLLKSFSN